MNIKKAVSKTATAACVCSNYVRPAIDRHKAPKPHLPLTTIGFSPPHHQLKKQEPKLLYQHTAKV